MVTENKISSLNNAERDIRVSLHRDIIYENDQQDATV
jgi:hypothetical protein